MTITAKIIFKLSAPFHSHDKNSRYHDLDELSTEDIEDFIDPNFAKFQINKGSLDIKISMLYGPIENPLVPGSIYTGFHSVQFIVTDRSEILTSAGRSFETKENVRKSVFQIMNKLISYMKYKKGNPFLRNAQIGDVTTWTWEDANGNIISQEKKGVILADFPGIKNSLDSQGLRKSDLSAINDYLLEDHEVNMVDDLLLQAKEAIFSSNIFLGVVLLAVSVEIKVKTAFLGGNTAASDAFDYSQEKGKLSISPVEFIDKIADTAFGESFKKNNPKAFIEIENLFRCRNKIVHRGVGKFRNTKGEEMNADISALKVWWSSVATLFIWLDVKNREQQEQ